MQTSQDDGRGGKGVLDTVPMVFQQIASSPRSRTEVSEAEMLDEVEGQRCAQSALYSGVKRLIPVADVSLELSVYCN